MSGLWIALRPAARSLAGASMWKATSSIAAPAMTSTIVRKYAAAHGLSRQDIEGRILEVLKSFDKVDGAKVWCFDALECTLQECASYSITRTARYKI